MRKRKSELSDAQWEKISKLLPRPKRRSRKGGRPPIDDRRVFEGILLVLRSGIRWKDLPESYPSASTCWRRLVEWDEQDVWLDAWRAFLSELDDKGQLDWAETFSDGSFSPAKKGGSASERPNVERVQSGWWWQAAKEFLWGTTWTRLPRRK